MICNIWAGQKNFGAGVMTQGGIVTIAASTFESNVLEHQGGTVISINSTNYKVLIHDSTFKYNGAFKRDYSVDYGVVYIEDT